MLYAGVAPDGRIDSLSGRAGRCLRRLFYWAFPPNPPGFTQTTGFPERLSSVIGWWERVVITLFGWSRMARIEPRCALRRHGPRQTTVIVAGTINSSTSFRSVASRAE